VHDFNAGLGPNGLFWTVQVPDDAVKIDDDNDKLTISLTNVAVVDQISFPNGTGNNQGMAGAPATVSFSITYRKVGTSRHVRAASRDPISPFHWAGKMWMATNSGMFSVAYNDDSFKAQGNFDSAGNFGEMGTERNGSFVRHDDDDEDAKALALAEQSPALAGGQWNESTPQPENSPKFRGKVPVEYLVH